MKNIYLVAFGGFLHKIIYFPRHVFAGCVCTSILLKLWQNMTFPTGQLDYYYNIILTNCNPDTCASNPVFWWSDPTVYNKNQNVYEIQKKSFKSIIFALNFETTTFQFQQLLIDTYPIIRKVSFDRFNPVPHLCLSQTRTCLRHMLFSLLFWVLIGSRWEVMIRFVDISEIVSHNVLNFLFIAYSFISRNILITFFDPYVESIYMTTSFHLLLKYIYQARKVNGHVFMC
jgi:hypothetical protein